MGALHPSSRGIRQRPPGSRLPCRRSAGGVVERPLAALADATDLRTTQGQPALDPRTGRGRNFPLFAGIAGNGPCGHVPLVSRLAIAPSWSARGWRPKWQSLRRRSVGKPEPGEPARCIFVVERALRAPNTMISGSSGRAGRHAAASSVASICLISRLPASLHRTHPSRPSDERHSEMSS